MAMPGLEPTAIARGLAESPGEFCGNHQKETAGGPDNLELFLALTFLQDAQADQVFFLFAITVVLAGYIGDFKFGRVSIRTDENQVVIINLGFVTTGSWVADSHLVIA